MLGYESAESTAVMSSRGINPQGKGLHGRVATSCPHAKGRYPNQDSVATLSPKQGVAHTILLTTRGAPLDVSSLALGRVSPRPRVWLVFLQLDYAFGLALFRCQKGLPC